MPEVAVAEDGEPLACEQDVGPPSQCGDVHPISMSAMPELSAQQQLAARVALPTGAPGGGAGLGGGRLQGFEARRPAHRWPVYSAQAWKLVGVTVESGTQPCVPLGYCEVMEGRPEDDRDLDAAFVVESVGADFAIIVKSGNGAGLNSDYNAGLERILTKLCAMKAVLRVALLDSSWFRDWSSDDLQLKLRDRPYPVPLEQVSDVAQLRADLCNAARPIGQSPGTSGGSLTRRLKLIVSIPEPIDTLQLREQLARPSDSPVRQSAVAVPVTYRAQRRPDSMPVRDIASARGRAHANRGTAMPTKRDIIEQLRRDELQSLAEMHELEVEDRRVREHLIDAVVRAKRIRVYEVLSELSRDRLKEIAEGLGLDTSGREKALIVDRICGEGDSTDAPEVVERETDTFGLLQELLGPAFDAESGSENCWPVRGALRVDGVVHQVSMYVRPIGGSSRGNVQERRFQNPSQRAPISDDPDRYELLLGLWNEQGPERAVIVAFDAYRRMDKLTRFSLFMPLSLLEQAADTGFATHDNTRGETLYAFRPDQMGKYVQAEIDAGTWQLRRPENERKKERAVAADTPAARVVPSDSIYIRPRVGMYTAFARLNYKPWFALAEFVDNSVQSFLARRDSLAAAGHDGPLIIDIDLDDNELTITDRAGGIAWKDFPRAFSPAAPPDDPSGLSEFGLGMKAAACWFSRRWSVRTSALGEPLERTVQFDIPRISKEGLEDLPIETRPARESDHFTVVSMRDLRVRPHGRTLAKIKEHLSSIYRVLMHENVVKLRVTSGGRTEDLRYEPPELLNAPYHRTPKGAPLVWRKDFSVDFHDRKVTGWAGIMKVGSHSKAGFSVFRRRRLIEGSVGETYKPQRIFGSPNSFASQRVIGELFVEGFDVTHTKDGIQWHGYEDEVLEAIYQQLETPQLPLLDQAAGYRARKTADTLGLDFGAEAVNSTANALPAATAQAVMVAQPISEDVPPVSLEMPPAPPSAVLQEREVSLQVERDGKPWHVLLQLVRDASKPFFVASTETREGVDTLLVQVNLDHEFSVAYINDNEAALQPLLRLIAAFALGEKLARNSGVRNASAIRANANELLRGFVPDRGGR